MKLIKLSCKLFIVLFILCCLNVRQVMAIKNIETTVTFVNINDNEFFDVEIMQSNNLILLPVKQMADILNIPIKINHETKDILINEYKITKNSIYKNGSLIAKNSNKYLLKGLMDETRDEIFIDDKKISEILKTKIVLNQNDLSILITTDKIYVNKTNDDTQIETKKPYDTYFNVKKPREKKKFSLDAIEYNSSMFSDSAVQIYKATRNKNTMFNNSFGVKFKGQLNGGDYEINTRQNNYKDEFFSFSGLNFKYSKKIGNNYYEFGKIDGINSKDGTNGGILGVQFYNYDKKYFRIQNIEGEVNPKSLVNIYINDKFYKTISTYDGYYSLSDFFYNKEKIKKFELKELKEDGQEKIIYSKIFPKYQDKEFNLKEKEKRKIGYVGILGFDDRLFAQDGYFYEANSKKLAIGYEEKYALHEDLILKTNILYDKIIEPSRNSLWGMNYFNNNSVLLMGRYKNPNNLNGITYSNAIYKLKNENWKLNSDVQLSYSKDIQKNNKSELGYAFQLNSIYEKNNFKFDFGIYNKSKDFYLASSRYGYISDRLGGLINTSYQFRNWNLGFKYNKYFSNILKDEQGGIIDFNEVNLNLRGRIKNIAQVRYSMNLRKGENNYGMNLNSFSDFNLMKQFKNGFMIEMGEQSSRFSSKNYEQSAYNDFNSIYSTIYLNTNYELPKNKGRIELGHDITDYKTSGNENKYNRFKIRYTFPEIKRFIFAFGAGYKYTGINKGFNYNAQVSYRTKSGLLLSVMYRYDTDMGYMFDNIFIPSSRRHSINFTINDSVAVVPKGLKSVGQITSEEGFINISAYLDKNNNGKYDDEDIGIKDVPFKISGNGNIFYTNKNGQVSGIKTEKGVYRVELDEEKLCANLSVRGDSSKKLVLIQPKKQTDIEFKLTSSIGQIKGNIKVVDDFKRIQTIKDFIVVLNDENGNEISYSTIDNLGNYYFSGISPGKYIIKLDENFIKKYNLLSYENKGEIKVDIPFLYQDFVTLENQNLVYKCY